MNFNFQLEIWPIPSGFQRPKTAANTEEIRKMVYERYPWMANPRLKYKVYLHRSSDDSRTDVIKLCFNSIMCLLSDGTVSLLNIWRKRSTAYARLRHFFMAGKSISFSWREKELISWEQITRNNLQMKCRPKKGKSRA